MARLKNPENNIDAIRQDYRDKHASAGAVLVCRKYPEPKQLIVDGEPKFDKSGNPVMLPPWHEAKSLTVNEGGYIDESKFYSESLKNDCYSTINHFPVEYPPDVFKAAHPGHKYRTADNVQYLTGFYIDFDNRAIHDIAKNQQAPADMVEDAQSYADFIVQTLEAYLTGGYIMPSLVPGFMALHASDDYGMPVISMTGGGYGFYFPIRPLIATAENKARYRETWEKLYRRFDILYQEILDVFENDHTVGGAERVIRITGTYNSKTGTFSRYIARYGNACTNEVYQYTLNDIIELYRLDDISIGEENICLVKDSPLPKKEKREEKKREEVDREATAMVADKATGLAYTNKNNIAYPDKWYKEWCNVKQLGRYLDLCERSLRYLDARGSLQRNNALFLAACLRTELEYAKYGYYVLEQSLVEIQREIVRYMMDLNDSLATPLDGDELAALIDHAGTLKYHFRRLETIQKYLNLSDVEFENLGWLDKQKQEALKKERNAALTDLDREVIKLYLSGLSDAKIAQKLGITKRTSINIRQRLGVTDRAVKFEDIDFYGNRRHARHDVKAEVLEWGPVIPYMPWYKPKSMDAKNAVAERVKVLAATRGGKVAESAMQFERSLECVTDRIMNMSAEEKRKILACFDAAQAQEQEQRKTDLINQKQRYYGECYDDYKEDYRKKYGMDFWEDIG